MIYRLIEEENYNAAMNMAIDHSLYLSSASSKIPTIRFYRWLNDSISLGAYQSNNDINLESCGKKGIDVVRRMTGGGAVFHSNSDFTYSFIAPIKIFQNDIEHAYRQITSPIISTLNELGMDASLQRKNDIMVQGKKISGNAAKLMNKGIYLQHGTLVYGLDIKSISECMNLDKELAKAKMTSISKCRSIPRSKVLSKLRGRFLCGKEFEISALTNDELNRAKELAKDRYSRLDAEQGTRLVNKGICYIQ